MSKDYQGAINAYDQTGKSSLGSPQEIEARALLKAADQIQLVKDNWQENNREELDDALSTNRKLWAIFVGEMEKEDTGLPVEIRSNIANLGIYTFKRTLEVISDPSPDKLDILININRNIAAGLLQNSQNQATNPQQQPINKTQQEDTAVSTPDPATEEYPDPQPTEPPPETEGNPTSFDV